MRSRGTTSTSPLAAPNGAVVHIAAKAAHNMCVAGARTPGPFHVQCFAPAHGITTTGTEESEPPHSQETHEGGAGEDDPEADGEDGEEPDSDEEEEEEEAEDAKGSVGDDTLENFSFGV